MEPLVLRCRILAPYVPLRATSSESVPGVDIVQRQITKNIVLQLPKLIIILVNLSSFLIGEYYEFEV